MLKLKIVWLCHFVNAEIKNFFNTPDVKEMAPWINTLINMFRYTGDIELHIVAPNVFTNKNINIKLKNIYYHFYQHRPSIFPKKIYNLFRIESLTNYYYIKLKVQEIINNINPDLIHLHGAENPYYSAGILPLIEHYPTLVTIQGFIRNTDQNNFITRKRKKIEDEILKKSKYIGVRTKDMTEMVQRINPNAQLFYHRYGTTKPNYRKENHSSSDFDIIYFARITKDKGIEDLLKALSLVKKVKEDISLHIIGPVSRSYSNYLNKLVKKLNIQSNIKFLGFMATQEDIYKYAVRAKIYVLPTYYDIIPGTIIESMFMKLPVIAYSVGGIPELNEKGKAVILVEKNNIDQLSIEIFDLLNDQNKRETMAEYAYNVAVNRFDDTNTVNQIINIYNEILSGKY